MFDALIEKMDVVELDPSELEDPLTLDLNGDVVALSGWIDQEAPADVKAAFGRAERPAPPVHVRPVEELDDQALRSLTRAVLAQSDPQEHLVVVGVGDFDRDSLIKEVESGSEVGVRFVRAVKRHSAFVAEAVRKGKIRLADKTSEVEPPALEF